MTAPTQLGSEPRSKWARARSESFGPASEEPYRRRVSDWIRLGIGVVAMTVLLLHQGHESQPELDLYRAMRDMTHELDSAVRLLYAIGALWAVALIVVAALVAKRRRLARDLLIAGLVTWVVARFIDAVDHGGTFSRSLDVFERYAHAAQEFPAVRLAIIVAVSSVAAPYLSRPARRVGQTLVLLMFLAAMYLGAAQFDDALAAIVLGWTVAAAVHLLFGSPGGRPTARQVRAALLELGVEVSDVALSRDQSRDFTRMVARDQHGSVEVRVLGRDEADAQLFSKFWRLVLYKEGPSSVHLTRVEDVEAEAYALLLAERGGVRVPHVIVAGSAGPGAALVLTRRPETVGALADVDPAMITDAVLTDAWVQVRRLHEAHVVHGQLNARHVRLGPNGVALSDFVHASGTANSDLGRAADVAELLASTAEIVGCERAVRAAAAVLDRDELVAALPVLQAAALTRETRPSGRRASQEFAKRLTDLRATLAEETDSEVPPLRELYRVNRGNLLMAVGTLIALVALFSQVGSPGQLWDTFKDADVVWLVVALVVALSMNFATAISLMGAVPMNLPLLRTAELQLSMSFSNLAVPAVGGMAAQVRFLQKQGMDVASAVASGGLLATVGDVAGEIMLLVVALELTPTKYDTARIDTNKLADIALIAILVIVAVAGLIVGIPRLRRAVATPARNAGSAIWGALRSPRRVALLLGGSIVNALLGAAVFLACIVSLGSSVNFWALLSMNIVIGTVASLIPMPGGGAAVSSVGMSGALAAAGVPIEVAVASSLLHQIITSYLPAIPGWFATKDLIRADYL
jgi:undecaprenyl-diphosphatase